MIDTLRKQHATWSDVDAAAANGMRVTLDFVGSIDGEEFDGGKAEGFTLELGAGRMIPGFEDAILGFGTWEAIPAGRAIVSAGTATETIDGTPNISQNTS